MARSFRTNLRTSSAPQHPPFKVEVANNRDILCHVGRVFEPLSSSIYGQNLQKSWDATQSKFTSKGLPDTRSGKIELKYHNYDVKTGSAKIYYKGTSSIASQGRSTHTSASQSVGDSGYVKWNRSSGPTHNYIVLHREVDTETPDTGKWCISAVESSAVRDSDIVIAYINNGRTVRQVWKSDVCFSGGSGGDNNNEGGSTQPHPFQIVKNDLTQQIYVREGTVNNVPASTSPTTAGNQWFWLRTYPSPVIGTSDGGKSESECWVSIGRVENNAGVVTVYQHLRNSLWMERFKCGSAPAKYWHSAV